MKLNPMQAALVVVLLVLCGASPSSSPTPSLSPNATPSPIQMGSKTLLKEFVNAQKTELKAIYHRYKFEMQELKASHKSRFKEWMKKEKEARHKFFEEHPKGEERRVYIKDYIRRQEEFQKMLSEEWSKRKQEQDVHTASLRQDHSAKLKEFKHSIDTGSTPSKDLWPKPGH